MPLSASAPSEQGVDAAGISDLLDAVAHLDLHSLAIARHGRTIAAGWWAPYSADRRHLLYSVSKSITASAVAVAAQDGVLDLDAPVLTHLPPLTPASGGAISDVWHRVTVRHCLTMTIGHTFDAWTSLDISPTDDLLSTILDTPPNAEPGSVFAYNQVATYLAARALEHASRTPLPTFVRDRILGPLGSEDLDWHTDHHGHALGFSGAHLRAGDLLALTQTWLDGGRYGGAQVLPAHWPALASRPALPVTDPASASDWEHGYGESFWIARHGYRADGAFGQYGIVLPEHDAVIAITSEVEDMQEVLDLLWQHLLPALDRPGSTEHDHALARRLGTLAIPALPGGAPAPAHALGHRGPGATPLAPEGTIDPAYTAVSLDQHRLVLHRSGVEHPIDVGHGVWLESLIRDGARTVPVVASGGWTSHGYHAQIRAIETPHRLLVDADAGADRARLAWHRVPLNGPDIFDLRGMG